MYLYKFSDGSEANLDLVTTVTLLPDESKVKVTLAGGAVLFVSADEWAEIEKKERDRISRTPSATDIRRLVEALDRLTVHIPTSIRAHF